MKVIKAQICNVTYTPTGTEFYYVDNDDARRLEVAHHLDEIKEHIQEGQQLVLTAVEMSEEDYNAIPTTSGWWKIWQQEATT